MSNYSADQIALVAHIEAENAKTQAWVDAGEGRWAGMITTDLEHWADYGITTVEGYERHMLVESYYDLYKSVNGIKPRWMDFESMSLAELQVAYDKLGMEADAQAQQAEDYRAAEEKRMAEQAEQLGVSLDTYKRWQEEEFGNNDEWYDQY